MAKLSHINKDIEKDAGGELKNDSGGELKKNAGNESGRKSR